MVRMAQTDELLAFVERTHRPENVAVIVGDFNVRVHDVDRPEQPNHWYEDLADRMARFDLVDTWAAAGVGPGHTCGGERDPFDEDDPDDPGRLLDDPSEPEGRPDRERIDFCWVQRSTPDHSIDVSFERPRRRAFHRTAGAKRRDLLPRMSDHLALEVTLDVRARTA
jgi:endonuclease/exonuclease/phosphatase family metal-dependent hydrolase